MKFLESILHFSNTSEKIFIFTISGISNDTIYLDKTEYYKKSTKFYSRARKISNC